MVVGVFVVGGELGGPGTVGDHRGSAFSSLTLRFQVFFMFTPIWMFPKIVVPPNHPF